MAVQTGMFLFEVVVENVEIKVDTRCLIIRSEFANVFSLELKDPKQMHIVMPEPLPLPPDPPGKKKKKPKPKPKKKGKKGKIELPPPEPVIQSGQSVLFTSNAEFLIQTMNKYCLEVSLWNQEDNFTFIGSNSIPWHPVFTQYLQKIANGIKVPVPITLGESYNMFEENTAKIVAKLWLQVKLTYLGDKVCSSFRTLNEDPIVKKVLYTGMNNKLTSYICTYKTTDEDFEQNSNKIENNYIIDKPVKQSGKINYADYKNAPGVNLTFFNEGDYCCMTNADKPPESIYKSPETCPDVDFIIDYVRKIIVSCNDSMRMLTPRPTICPRVKATDIDRLCYCKETEWPEGGLADRFKKAAQSEPCPLCIDAGNSSEEHTMKFDIANMRGPCGKPDCRIARDLRAYIENLVDEDNQRFDLNELIGPCGSKSCTMVEKILQFIRHEGVFRRPATVEGLSTQCACIQTMQKALNKRTTSCESICTKDCQNSDSDVSSCDGKLCPFKAKNQVYDVYYFTVELDNKSLRGSAGSSPSETPGTTTPKEKKEICSSDCIYSKSASERVTCSKTTCSTGSRKDDSEYSTSKCQTPVCEQIGDFPPSPADSNVVLNFRDIYSPCCVKTCDVADKVKQFISDAVLASKRKAKAAAVDVDDPCYCDCVCTFKLAKHTTYCAVCGGYECLGDDMADQPSYVQPHPCPVYNKLYDRKIIKTPKIWADEEDNVDEPATPKMAAKKKVSRPAPKTKEAETKDKKPKDETKEQKEPGAEDSNEKKKKEKRNKDSKHSAEVETRRRYTLILSMVYFDSLEPIHTERGD